MSGRLERDIALFLLLITASLRNVYCPPRSTQQAVVQPLDWCVAAAAAMLSFAHLRAKRSGLSKDLMNLMLCGNSTTPPLTHTLPFSELRPNATRTPWLSCLSAQSYWPVHKSWCRTNDFATAMESRDPKFAAWMRLHGKQAVIKVIVRLVRLIAGPSHDCVMSLSDFTLLRLSVQNSEMLQAKW
jgi:hypothetical protein